MTKDFYKNSIHLKKYVYSVEEKIIKYKIGHVNLIQLKATFFSFFF